VRSTFDGGYIITGLQEQQGAYHIFLAKFDCSGTLEWQKTYGENLSYHHYGHAVEQTKDSGFIVTGNYRSGAGNVFLMKVDPTGNMLWFKTYVAGESWKVRQTFDNGFVIVGTEGVTVRMLLTKTDSVGTLQWTKTYGAIPSNFVVGIDVKQTSDSGYIAIGSRRSNGNENVFVVKTDSAGVVQWAKEYDYNPVDKGYSILQTSSGDYVMEGFSLVAIGNTRNFLIKTDNVGTPLWTRVYSHTSITDYQGFWNELQPTADSGFIFGHETGINPYTTFLCKVNSSGNVQWSHAYDTGLVHSLIQTADLGYAFVGWNNDYVYFVKTDSSGYSGCNQTVVNIVGLSATYAVTNPTVIVTNYTTQSTPVIQTFSPVLTVTTACESSNIPPLVVGVSSDTICSGQTTSISVSGGLSYSWSNGSTSSSVNVNPTATTSYSVTVQRICSDTVLVFQIVVLSATANAGPSVTISSGDSTVLSATGGGTYSWNTGETSQTITVSPTVTTTYCVEVTNSNFCTDTACVTVYVVNDSISNPGPCEELFVPSAFSPNGDGVNDVLFIRGGCIKTMNFAVYDRWGEKVFTTTDISQGWDGKYQNEDLNNAVFVYYLDVILDSNKAVTLKGDVTLVR
jgi:gliding motility-associated-like protein